MAGGWRIDVGGGKGEGEKAGVTERNFSQQITVFVIALIIEVPWLYM